MFLVKLIDVFVGMMTFLFKGDRRRGSGTPMALGALGIILLLAGLVVAIGAPKAWYQVRTSPFVAELDNASGLSGGDPVYVAGVPAGRVEGIELAGDHVRVDFRLDKRQPLGNQSTATVRLKTVLGKRYLEVVPAGVDDGDTVIPRSRTTVPYSLDDVSRDATEAAKGVDLDSMQAMMTTLSQVMPADSEQLGKTLAGLSGASAAFAENGQQVDELLAMSRSLSDLVVRQSDSLTTTMSNAQTVIQILAVRKHALTELVDNLSAVIATASTSMTDHQEEFGLMVTNLVSITDTLKRNADNIELLMDRLPPALRSAADATGNGAWTDVNAPAAVIPDNLLCAIGVMQGCR
ncbi:MCE family protein [Rhodococcus sp. NPDC058481]|uniref:MCE family protein n=1 Tax=unclassified Rhodococcus (in: high G+C Gram-positive bacteria) TaxID=192944 RepID=UPI003660B1B2